MGRNIQWGSHTASAILLVELNQPSSCIDLFILWAQVVSVKIPGDGIPDDSIHLSEVIWKSSHGKTWVGLSLPKA